MSGQSRRPWTLQVYQFPIQQDEAIRTIVSQLGTKHWSDISQLMQEKYKLLGRSGKQCRERWHNHLAPQVNKRPWTRQEEQLLFEAHKKHGNKWTQISKLIIGRTDNAIKNYFYSSIRRSFRRINKILGSKNSTIKMRTIKPAVLSKIFNLADKQQDSNFQHFKCLTASLVLFSRNRIKKQKLLNQNQKTELQTIIKKLIQFNDLYQKNKKINKKISHDHSSENNTNTIKSQIKISTTNNQLLNIKQQHSQQSSIHSDIFIKKIDLQSYENCPKIKLPLQQSQYDWQQFQSRCQTIKNRFRNNLKSTENILGNQINLISITDTSNHSKKTPAKSEKQTLCSSSDVRLFDINYKCH